MKFNWFIGIDVSKKTLDITIFNATGKILFKQIGNDVKELKKLIKELSSQEIILSESLFCMEHTGIYCMPILEVSEKLTLNLWIENATEIKFSMGLQRGKNDKIDSGRIAEYALRNQHKACLKQPDREAIKQLRSLNLARTRLVTTIKGLQVVSQEQDYYKSKSVFKSHFKQSLKALKQDLKSIESAIKKVIQSDQRLKELFEIVVSIKGIGNVMALNMILTTNEFNNFSDPKKYACYCGVVPFEHSSGSSVRGKNRLSKKANMTIKSLLHMAALSAIRTNKEMIAFYQRKVKEGKSKMSVINAVRNKLIHRVFACVRDNRKYEDYYTNALA